MFVTFGTDYYTQGTHESVYKHTRQYYWIAYTVHYMCHESWAKSRESVQQRKEGRFKVFPNFRKTGALSYIEVW